MGLQYPVLDDRSPLTELATDVAKGTLRQDVLDERTGWVCLKMVMPEKRAPKVFQELQQVATEIDTVFALDLVSRVDKDGSTAADRVASEIGIEPAPNCKTNIGLGRPLAES